MAKILPSREVIFQEDTAYRRSVSEVILSKFGAQSNFINDFQQDAKKWIINGKFRANPGTIFFDGPEVLFFNTEIVGYSFWHEQGTAGQTRFDLRWRNQAGVDQGSLLSTKPVISNTASVVAFESFVTGFDITPAGVTMPVFNKTTFLQGEAIYFVIEQAQNNAKNTGMIIYYRPIN